MQLITHLNFNGNCKAAFDFYAAALNGKITMMMTWGDSPMANTAPPEMKSRIMHASMELPQGAVLMGADHPQGKHVKPCGFCVSLQLNDTAEAKRLFELLSHGGQVQMPFQKTFWSPGFGMCTDQFEIPWMVNTAPGE